MIFGVRDLFSIVKPLHDLDERDIVEFPMGQTRATMLIGRSISPPVEGATTTNTILGHHNRERRRQRLRQSSPFLDV